MEKTESERIEESKNVIVTASILVTVGVAYILGYTGSCASTEELAFFPALGNAFMNLGNGQLFYMPSLLSFKYAIVSPLFGALCYFWLSNDYRKNQSAKRGTEEGTARFATKKEISEYNQECGEDPPVIVPTENRPIIEYDPEKDKQMYPQSFIMSQHLRRPCDLRRSAVIGNNNIMIVGGAGTGKSRFVMKPNLLQMNCSYVITDPSGEMIESIGSVLRDHGYKIKIFNISDMGHSNCYNPLAYIRDEAGVDMLIECLINNTTKGEGGGDNQFFVDAEKLLYSACIFYLKDYCNNVMQKTFSSIVKLINMSKVDENNPNAKSPLDRLFDAIPQDSLAATRYRAFKQAAGKTLKSIIISCVVRLRPFMTPQVVNLTNSDSLDLSQIGYEKTALFIITPQADRTYAFLASMLYSQLFETLYHEGEERKAKGLSEELPIPVRCMMDEFANIGEVPEFPSKLATMRKYNISATIVLQDIAQIEAMYEDNWKTLVGNCSTFIFLGTQEPNTLKYYSELLGNQTIRVKSENRSEGPRGSASKGFQASGRPLMTPDELMRMPKMDCIVFTQNKYPVYDKKYDYTQHPYYKWTGDADKQYSYLYKTMQVYDNTKRSRLTGILQAVSEAQRFRKIKEQPEIKRANDIVLDQNIEHTVRFDDETEKKIYESLLNQYMITGADNIKNGVCVISNIGSFPSAHIHRLARETSAFLAVPMLMIFSDDENGVRQCIGYGRTESDQNRLTAAMTNEIAEKIVRRKNDPFIMTAIPSSSFDDYVTSVRGAIDII